MLPSKGNKVALLAGALLTGMLLATCLGPAWKRDPDVQAVKAACLSLPKAEQFACIEREAVARLNPDVCRLAGIAIDDACLQSVYEAAGGPAICNRIYLRGVVLNCWAWYGLPTPAP